MAGFCPDCAPTVLEVGSGQVVGPHSARAKGRTVERVREDGALDWYTVHLTRRGARHAARLYERTGKIRGWRP